MPQLIARGRKPLKSMLVASVAAISIGVASPVIAQESTADTETTKTLSSITHKVEIGAIDLTNANMDEVTLRAILTGKLAENADKLAGLNADRVRIPELRFSYEVTVEDQKTTSEMVFREIVLENVKDGVAARAAIGETLGDFGATGMPDNPVDEMTFSYGASEIIDMNLPALLGAYGMIEVEKTDEFETIYQSYNLAGGTLSSKVFGCEFGPTQSGTFRAKPSAMDFAKLGELMKEMEAASGKNPNQEQIGSFIDFYAQMLFGFESGVTTMEGIACSGEDDGQKFAVSTGEISIGSFGNGIYPAFSVDEIDVKVEGKDAGTFYIDNFTFKEIDFGPTFEKLGEASDYTEQWFQANMRGLIPAVKGLSFSGMTFDVPNNENTSERVVGSVEKFDLTLSQYRNGIPAEIRLEGSGIEAELPEKSDDENVQKLIDAGYEQVSLGFLADLSWDSGAEVIQINALDIAIKDMGVVEIDGTLGGATEALFASEPQTAMMAAMSLAVTDLNILVDDDGLVEFAMAEAAAEQGAPVEAFANQVTAMSQGMIVGMLGGTDAAVRLGEDVAGFLRGGQTITVNLTAKSERGVGMPQLMMLQSNPTKLLEIVDLNSSLE